MSPHSCNRHRAPSRAPFLPLLAAAVAAAVVLLPVAALAARVTVSRSTDRDTSVVREITIDDEGIRVVGGNKGIVVPYGIDAESLQIEIDEAHGTVIDAFDSRSGVRGHSGGESEIVQFFKDVTIEKGESAGDVVSMFGNVKNFGLIRGDCVAILGSIEQGDSAIIAGDAVSIGGAIRDLGSGARVEGQTVSIGFLPFAGFAIPSVPLMLFFGLFAFVLFVGLAALFGRLFPERIVGMARTISRRTFLSLVLGLLSGPLALMLALLLLVTVIGIPLALLLPLLYGLAAFVGYVAAAYLLGCKLLRVPLDPKGGMLAPIAAGTGFITLFYVLGVPLIAFEGGFRMFGFALLALWVVIGKVCWMVGFGALLLSRLGQEDGTTAVQPGAMTAPPPYPVANPQSM